MLTSAWCRCFASSLPVLPATRMSRDDLLGNQPQGYEIRGRRHCCPRSQKIVCDLPITNPLDAMVVGRWPAKKFSGLPTKKFPGGMAGVLDAAALPSLPQRESRVHEGRHLGSSLAHGEHHGSPDALFDRCRHFPLPDSGEAGLDDAKTSFDAIVQRTRDGGAEIVGLLKNGLCVLPRLRRPAVQMAEAYLKDQKALAALCGGIVTASLALKACMSAVADSLSVPAGSNGSAISRLSKERAGAMLTAPVNAVKGPNGGLQGIDDSLV